MFFLDLLPGLLVIAWAVALFAGLERWFDAVPRRWAAALLGLVLVLFGPSLFGGKILLPLDNLRSTVPFQNLPAAPLPGNHLQTEQITLIAPLAAAVRSDFADGRWPLWDEHSGAGLPLLGMPRAAAFSPFRLATLPLPLEQAAGAAAALQVLMALVFGWLWLRRSGASGGAAGVGALAYGLGGFVLLWLGWPTGGAAALVPLLLYSIERVLAKEGERRGDLLLLVGATLALALAGDGEVALWGGLAAVLLLALRLAQQPAEQRPRRWLRATGAMGLALALAAPVLLPQRDWNEASGDSRQAMERALSERRTDPFALETLADPERRTRAGQGVIGRLAPLVAAGAFTEHRTALYPGLINRNEDASGFAGTVTLWLALLAFALPARRRPATSDATANPSHRVFPTALALGAAVLVFNPPGLSYVLNALPLLGPSATSHRRLAMLLTLGLAGLAALGVDRLRNTSASRMRFVLTALGLAMALALAIVWASPEGVPWLQIAVLAVGVIGVMALWKAQWQGRWLAPCLALAIAAELLVLHLPAHRPMPRDLYYPTQPVLAALQQAAEEHPDGRLAAPRGVLLPRIASIYGISDARAGRLAPALYEDLTGFLHGLPAAGRTAHFEDPRLDLLGVRWWLTGPEDDVPDATAPGRLLYEDASARLWERPRPLGRLFLPEEAEILREGRWEDRIGELDPGRTSLVRADISATAWRAIRPTASHLQVGPPEDDALSAAAVLAEPRLLASSLYQDGGWRLLVDGQAHPTFLANGPLLAAMLPTGEHSLRLLYRPRSLVHGTVWAGLALLVMALWVAAPRLR